MLHRPIILFLLCALPIPAAVELYLKDGTYQQVREYQVLQDRVRYYSIERSDWEEIPLELIDLQKTRDEEAKIANERKKEAVILDAEDKAERDQEREISRIPQQTGVYWIDGEKLTPLKQAESKVVTDKKRSILKVMAPIPIVSGKATVEIDGAASPFVVNSERPEFYFRLVNPERFNIVKLTPQKEARIVERWTIIPVSKELEQETVPVEIFRQQVGDSLYKIWPQKPIEPGEYAVIEYTEGQGNTQIWDFSFRPAAKN